jgi:predicted AlkP superfamily phosphohydrolase/phosphomutase
MAEENPGLSCDGVFPPDSPTSWATIFTGVNPAKHGIVLFLDPLARVSRMIQQDVDDTSLHGKTVWDIAGREGKRVCVALHLLGYPVWAVNGIMIGRSGVSPDVQVYPEEAYDRLNAGRFRWDLNLFPGRNKRRFLEDARRQIEAEVEVIRRLLHHENWDLFVGSFGELDIIQYAFWNYFDKSDPTYRATSSYSRAIPDFYELFDRVVGELFSGLPDDVVKIVVSDHGIGSRPKSTLNINELLRRQGLLTTRHESEGTTDNGRTRLVSLLRLRRALVRLVDEFDLGNVGALALRSFPSLKEVLVAGQNVNYNASRAYLTDQSGIKVYPYGGIVVREDLMTRSEYDEIRARIIETMRTVVGPDARGPPVAWIHRREELYNGENIDRYPSILFELRDDLGASGETPGPLFGTASAHNVVPGCHKQHHATFLASGLAGRPFSRRTVTLADITPTVLDLLGIHPPNELDGSTVLVAR